LAHGAVSLLMQSMAFSLAAVQLALAHCAIDILMRSMAFSLPAVQLALCSRRCRRAYAVDGILICSRELALAYGPVGVLMQSMAFSLAAVQPALGSQRCRRAHAVDGILTCNRAACSWLMALSVCSCGRWHSHSQQCSLLLTHGAVGVLMRLMAFSPAAV
jgi:hypothetical protein